MDQALRTAEAAGDRLTEAASLNNLGLVAFNRGELDGAEDYLKRGWQIVRAQGAQVAGDSGRQQFGETHARYVANLLLVQLQRNRFDAAFNTLEEGRAQALVQAMAERGVTGQMTPPEIWQAYQNTVSAHDAAFKEAERSAGPGSAISLAHGLPACNRMAEFRGQGNIGLSDGLNRPFRKAGTARIFR